MLTIVGHRQLPGCRVKTQRPEPEWQVRVGHTFPCEAVPPKKTLGTLYAVHIIITVVSMAGEVIFPDRGQPLAEVKRSHGKSGGHRSSIAKFELTRCIKQPQGSRCPYLQY